MLKGDRPLFVALDQLKKSDDVDSDLPLDEPIRCPK